MKQTRIVQRPRTVTPHQWGPEIPEIIQTILAARGVSGPEELERRLSRLLSPNGLGGIDNAAALIAQAIMAEQDIIVAGDYDCDGATGTSVAVRGLKMLGAKHVRFIVPNRFKHGYGLSPELVADMQPVPKMIVTVDSGVSSVEGVAAAKALGITVVITDHHLPGDILPNADAIVNPNLKEDGFPSKFLAGVGVMFYVLLVVRKHLRLAGWLDRDPPLQDLLDLVAVGTVADLVPLDQNNRILVNAGLHLIRAGKASAGLKEIMENAGVNPQMIVATDIGFKIGPRINAAGRLEDMRIGVMALISDEPRMAKVYASQLETINQERKDRTAEMLGEAEALVMSTANTDAMGVVVFDGSWHSGIVGLVASKLKETLHRPVIALAPVEEGSDEIRGSCRSIPGFHLRDALALVDARHPGLMDKFGGHAMAAGLSLKRQNVEALTKAFDSVAREMLTDDMLQSVIYVDGPVPEGGFTQEFCEYVQSFGPWGQGFPEPIFLNTFFIEDIKILAQKHLKFSLTDPRTGQTVDAIQFNGNDGTHIDQLVELAFELSLNQWKDRISVQLLVRERRNVGESQHESQSESEVLLDAVS